jgi:hypothetical protein
MQSSARWAALIAALWAGVLLCIGAIAAPAGFALLAPADAGRVAGRLLAIEAYLSLALVMLLFAIERKSARAAAAAGTGSAFSTNIVLLFGALFCTVAMMAAARAGQGAWSFGALHAASSSLFVLKGLLVLALAWRLTAATR